MLQYQSRSSKYELDSKYTDKKQRLSFFSCYGTRVILLNQAFLVFQWLSI